MNIIENFLNFVTDNKEWISENKNAVMFICFLAVLCFVLFLLYEFYKSNTSNIVNNINENNKSISIKNNKGNITIDNSDKIIKNFRIDYNNFSDLT
ncbi:hypothetical protein HDR59_01600, partial [bacterium]|nr:hypothetical protein [bacterium]